MDITSQEAAVFYELCQCFSRGTEQNHGKIKTVQLRKQNPCHQHHVHEGLDVFPVPPIPCFLVYLFIYLFIYR